MALWNSTDTPASKPKSSSAAEKAKTFGVDKAEATANRNTGMRTPGWNTYTTYTDASGNVRHKAECLVVMSSMTLDAEDVVVKDNVITITTQVENKVVTGPATATFTITANVTNGDTLVYQWQKSEAGSTTWSNVGTNSASFTTGATSGADNNDRYRCVLSASNAPIKTSKAAKLTVQ